MHCMHCLQQPKNQPNPPNDMPPSAPQRRPFRPHFTYLYRLVLTRSRAPECPKANHFLTHLALLVGPDTLYRPATAQKSLGRGRPPPHPRPPLRRCAASCVLWFCVAYCIYPGFCSSWKYLHVPPHASICLFVCWLEPGCNKLLPNAVRPAAVAVVGGTVKLVDTCTPLNGLHVPPHAVGRARWCALNRWKAH
jgi:hypothetical protein